MRKEGGSGGGRVDLFRDLIRLMPVVLPEVLSDVDPVRDFFMKLKFPYH